MPTLDQHPATRRVKCLVIGDPGTGKTGALAALANAGYKVVIADMEGGLDVLLNYVKPECRKNVIYKTFSNKFKGTRTGAETSNPRAFGDLMEELNNWKGEDGEPDLGPISSWDADTIFCLDTMTGVGRTALNFVNALNGAKLTDDDPWGTRRSSASDMQESLAEMLASDSIACNIIINFHILYTEGYGDVSKDSEGSNVIKGYPAMIRKAMSPQIARYFNTILLAQTRMNGGKAERIFRTQSTSMIDIKNPVADKLPTELPIETGLATLFDVFKSLGNVKDTTGE